MQKNTIAFLGLCTFMGAVLVLAAWYLISPGSGQDTTDEDITVGLLPDESAALIYIARDTGSFARHGINLTIRNYPHGAAAIEGMKKGEIQVAVPTEYPVAASALQNDDIVVFGSINRYYGTFLVARNITDVSGLRNRQVAMPGQTIAEFYLSRFLALHNLSPQDLTVRRMLPQQSVPALTVNRSIDAVMVRRIVYETQINRTGAAYTVWPVQSDRPTYTVLVAPSGWVRDRPDRTKRFLQALLEAEQYSAAHPSETDAILRQRLNVTDAYIAAARQDNRFSLTFDQSFLLATEDEAAWMIKNNLSAATRTPNLLQFIDTSGMRQVKPEAVNIIQGG